MSNLLFCEKPENVSKCRLLKNLPSVLSVNWAYAGYYNIYMFYSGVKSTSTIHQSRCLDVSSISVLTFRVLPRWISRHRHLTRYSAQSHYTDTELTTPGSKNFFLNLGLQAKEQLAQFLKSLLWLGRGSSRNLPVTKRILWSNKGHVVCLSSVKVE